MDRDLAALVGGGSAVSTATDLFRFVRAVRRGLVPGVSWRFLSGEGDVSWTGASAGYFAWVDWRATDDLLIVWLGNTWGDAAGALHSALPAMLRGEDVTPPAIPAAAAEPDEVTLREYVGDYQIRVCATTQVWIRDGLRLDDNYLVPTGRDEFWQPAVSQPVRFIRDGDGRITAMEQGAVGAATR